MKKIFENKLLQETFEKIIESGFIAIAVQNPKNENKFFEWFHYFKEGVGTAYVEIDSLTYGLCLSSSYKPSRKAGSGARYRELNSVPGISDLENALRFCWSQDISSVEFITDLKNFFEINDYWFPYMKIFTKDGEFTPYDFIKELNGLYIVQHGPNFIAQLYSSKPQLEENAIAVKIDHGAFVEVKGSQKEQLALIKKAFPYLKENDFTLVPF